MMKPRDIRKKVEKRDSCTGPSPEYSSRGEKPEGGAHFKNTVLDVCSNQGAKREMGGHRFQIGGPGTTGPPAGDGPAPATNASS